ncbi:MAG: aldose 1-epimerase [Halioglobus sp.]|jgi:aldose 1-epimerase
MLASESAVGQLPKIQRITLTNANGDSAVILSLGAILAELNINTRKHGLINTVLGYQHPSSYLKDTAFHGVIAGRYCNRIANSRFAINSDEYELNRNEDPHHLHGGSQGFGRRYWSILEQSQSSVILSLHSPDGDQGYPGNLDVSLRYELKEQGCLDISWRATSDKDTVVSLTCHAYFNLAGHSDIGSHFLRICADHYTPAAADMIPTGEIQSVDGTALDLRKLTSLQGVLDSEDPEITQQGGLDHNWARGAVGEMLLTAELFCPSSGLLLQTSSTLPGLQCYTGNHLMANGIHGCHEGVCLEPQYYPNSPNEPAFPSPILQPGETMSHRMRYQITEARTAT